MKSPFTSSLVVCGLAFMMLNGCDRHDQPAPQTAAPAQPVPVTPVPAPSPVIINNQPAPPPEIIVQEAEPAPIVEVVPPTPGPEFIWAPGGWYRDEHRRWVWRRGAWNHHDHDDHHEEHRDRR